MKDYENNTQAEIAILKALNSGILDQAKAGFVDAKTICDTADHGVSQTRKVIVRGMMGDYRIEALVYISAEIVRPVTEGRE